MPQARAALERAHELAPEDAALARELRELYLELGDDAASDRVAGARDRGYFLAQAKAALAAPALARALGGGGALADRGRGARRRGPRPRPSARS